VPVLTREGEPLQGLEGLQQQGSGQGSCPVAFEHDMGGSLGRLIHRVFVAQRSSRARAGEGTQTSQHTAPPDQRADGVAVWLAAALPFALAAPMDGRAGARPVSSAMASGSGAQTHAASPQAGSRARHHRADQGGDSARRPGGMEVAASRGAARARGAHARRPTGPAHRRACRRRPTTHQSPRAGPPSAVGAPPPYVCTRFVCWCRGTGR